MLLRFVATSDRILRKMHKSDSLANGKFVSRELNLMNEREQVSLNPQLLLKFCIKRTQFIPRTVFKIECGLRLA